ncbi:Alpha/Beta hydrolase protein [Diaporthe sp. PMI_573]|nr:Alpha/Beta hydrolase protein [Diaporthaceae sp. PMI_573]
MSSSKPVIVLVPGAWTPPTAYHKLTDILKSPPYNYTVVRSALEPLVTAGREVVLVMHSYGGVVGSSASKDLTKKDRQAVGLPGGISHLFYISAYLLAKDQSAWDVLVEAGGDTPERRTLVEFKDDGTWLPTDAISGLYHDLDPEDQKEQVAGIRPHFFTALMGKATHEPWKDVPSTYIYSAEDVWVPPSFQDICLNNAKKAGKHVDVHKFPCAHAAYVNHRKEVAELIHRAAVPTSAE